MKRANTIFMRERFLGYVMSEVGSSFLRGFFYARFQLRLSIIKGTRQFFFLCDLDADRLRSYISCTPFYAGFLTRNNAYPNVPAVVLLI
jgi:hypothetical protein